MSELTYVPPDLLGRVEIGSIVEVCDRDRRSIGRTTVTRIRPRYVLTDCGRRWTRDRGEWISEFRGNKPVYWPFPSIRTACAKCDTFHDTDEADADCRRLAKVTK